MTNLRADPIPTAKGINWREARYLARVVQMLVKSPDDPEEFRRELENLLRAAEALRAGLVSSRGMDWESEEFEAAPLVPKRAGRAHLAAMHAGSARGGAAAAHVRARSVEENEAAWAAESAVVELWRSSPMAAQPRGVVALRARSADARPVDDAELALAVEEIELAAAVLRAEELLPKQTRRISDVPENPMPLRQQVMEFWLPIVAAMVGIAAALMSFMR